MSNVRLSSSFGYPVGVLLLGALLYGLLTSSTPRVWAEQPTVGPRHSSAPITSTDLLNMTYPSTFTAEPEVTLVDGFYTEPVAPELAARIGIEFRRAAFGTIDGRDAAAVVLASSGGGSGTFYELHLVMRANDGRLRSIAQKELGDRIGLQGLTFIDEAIRVDFTGFAPGDAACCPTLNVAHEYVPEEGTLELVRAEEVPALLAIPEGLSIIGWFGRPTTSSAILGASPPLETIWAYVPENGSWLADSRLLPNSVRQTILVDRGSGLFVVARWATEIPVPLMPPPAACPLNPGPPNPTNPSIIVHLPGNGEVLSGTVPVAGLARVFEGTVSIRVLAADGSVLADTFTTAEVGGPSFGAFASEVPVSVAEQTEACVQIFEESAMDGSHVNVVQIGVTLMPAQ